MHRHDAGLAMKQALTRRFFAYWDEIRGDRLAPERADIDPISIRGLLGYVFLLEIDRACSFPFRLCGSYINALFLRELRETSFVDLWHTHRCAEVTEILFSVLDEALPALMGTSAGPAGHVAIDLELLLLPLRHHGKTHARVLGALAPARHPSWFGLIATEPLNLHSLRILRPDETRGLFLRSPRREEDFPFPTEATAQATISRRDHLKVYSSAG